jgi:hypothetical protein
MAGLRGGAVSYERGGPVQEPKEPKVKAEGAKTPKGGGGDDGTDADPKKKGGHSQTPDTKHETQIPKSETRDSNPSTRNTKS